MNKAVAATALAVFLSGCYVEPTPVDAGCGDMFDVVSDTVTASGVMVVPSHDVYLSPEDVESEYAYVQSCSGLSAPGPIVEFRGFSHLGLPQLSGVYMPVHQKVMVNTELEYRDCDTDRQTLRHEYLHHLLYMNGLEDSSHSHSSPYFEQCDALAPAAQN